MRIPALVAFALTATLSCTPAPSAAPTPTTSTAPPASGARVRTTYTDAAPGIDTLLEITPGADARLLLALGDRVSELDLTPAEGTASEKQGDALLTFAPVAKGETARVRVRARPWAGHEVMRDFVVPFGGEEGAKALATASPDFVKHKMIEVNVDVTVVPSPQTSPSKGTPAQARTQSITKRIALPLTDEPARATPYEVGDVMAFGAPVRIEDWVMASTATAYVPAIRMTGTTLSASAPDGKEVPLEGLSAAVWTLWLQLEPATAP